MGTGRTRSRGQGLVEFVLIAPLLLLLLLATVEFGRAFMGWVSINNASRVAASYAATHPDDWPTSDGTQPASYQDAIDASLGWLNCTLDDPAPAPDFGADRSPGSIVRVTFTCRYSIATPVLDAVLGNEVRLSASTAYPITGGCIANCGPSTATSPPGTGAESGCRAVPLLTGLSVLGARTAWANAGFLEENFSTDDETATRTVDHATVTDDPAAPPCPGAQRFFTASVSVGVVEEPSPPPTPTCQFVPNLMGMTVADARGAWEALGWGGTFTPSTTERDHHIVFAQVTDPASSPGDCVEPDPPFAGVEVAYAPPPPPPPAAPCQVPSLVNTVTGTPSDPTGAALSAWTGAGFSGDLTFHNPNLPWTIKAQTLVGGTYQACDASMEVRR